MTDIAGPDSPPGRAMRRIVIVGTTGSGKSVLAEGLARRLSLPPIELDALFWMPGWQPALIELFRYRVETATQANDWIIVGNYSQVRDLVWGRADTLIWLDFPLPLVLWRLLRRTVRRVISREDLWDTGNRESVRRSFFSRQSILLWALKTHRRNRERFNADIESGIYGELDVRVFRSPGALRRWIRNLAPARA
ncbi:adenylate kinase [Vineibacter terrae]|uniref:Adenylate kinase n=1 Tax=Vineibacter terrae TaxID=2586908 RepID=A0A5C8PUK4_9HYPH|nr:adenylate kinase [Vineibacter terrae]TXL81907.1 adenylate kinase [Vineibacter terrae]